jgi:endogenous inhibitor of DNA gyrase (YacG/DUF329 family)
MKWRCPYCRCEMEIGSLDELPHMPFCSERCLMADLDGWLTGRYMFSRPIEDGDLGETSMADLHPPVDENQRRPHGRDK